MKEENLISKWLDHDLTAEKLEAFKKLDAFRTLNQLSETAKQFKAPAFNTTNNYARLKGKLASEKKAKSVSLWKPLLAVAAVIAVCLSLYFTLFYTSEELFIAQNGEQIQLVLPDASTVELNAGSRISYSERDWQENRALRLEGEAFFKVEKGQKFTVKTAQGLVAVLGTQFHVKQRADYFEVACYEGLVAVTYQGKTQSLPAGGLFRVINGVFEMNIVSVEEPLWLHGSTRFESVPVIEALAEIERQFDIKITTEGFDTTAVYTGTISHKDLSEAIDAIAIPLGLEVFISEKSVTLKK